MLGFTWCNGETGRFYTNDSAEEVYYNTRNM